MNRLVLRQQLHLLLETRHLLREHREDVPLFDRVVHGEVAAEFFGGAKVGPDAHAGWSLAGAGGVVEFVPGGAEVVVLFKCQDYTSGQCR